MNIDKDLEFLLELPSRSLDGLVRTIVYDKNNVERKTETLTVSCSYEEYYPDHSKYVYDIADEVLCFGGSLIMNILRGLRGPSYHKVVSKVCKKLNVFESGKDVEFYERKILDNMSTIIQDNDVASQCALHIARLRKNV